MKSHAIKVIDSTYEVDEANEVILSLIADKIKFLNAKKFSNTIRFGDDSNHLAARAKQLTQEVEILKSVMAEAKENDVIAKINCTLDIEFVKAEVLV